MADALPKRAMLVVNAESRRGAAAFEEVRDKLAAAGLELMDAHAVQNPEVMEPIVKAAIAKAPMVIVGGGDGTLSSAVDHFVGTDTVFAVLPLGTANSFARTLGLPLDLDGAIEVIAHGRRKRIDLGIIDGDYFANAAALGLSPLIADTVPHGLKRYLGMVGYLVVGGAGGVQVPAVQAAHHARRRQHRQKLGDRGADRQRAASRRGRAGRKPEARQRRDGHPGGDREEPVGPGVELVRDAVQAAPAGADDDRMAGQADDPRRPAAPEDQHRRRDRGADSGDGRGGARRDRGRGAEGRTTPPLDEQGLRRVRSGKRGAPPSTASAG